MEDARPASPADFERVRQLRAEAAAEVSGRRGGHLLLASSRPPDRSGVPVHDDDATRLVVGTLDGQVVGYGAATVIDVGGELLGMVDELYVETRGRGVGVGEAMLRALMAWARSRGCDQMDGRALPGDRETKGLFERQGFSARLLVMSRVLPAPRDVSDGGDDVSGE